MKLYYNKVTGILGAVAGATTNVAKLTAKRFQDVDVEIVPTAEDGSASSFAPGSTGLLVVKAENDFSGAAKLLDAAWDTPEETGRGYVFSFLAAGQGVDAALGTEASKTFALEMVIAEGGKRLVLPTVQLVLENNYYREGEAIPEDPEVPYPLPGEIVTSGQLATQAEAEAGTANGKWMSPLRVAQAIAAWVSANVSLAWEAISGKPDTFPPSEHSHEISEVNGLETALGGGETSFVGKTSSFSAEAGKSYSVDTTGGEVTAILPASPTEGDVIQFADAAGKWADNNFLVNPNGGKVFGNTGNFRTRTPAVLMVFVFVGGDRGWAMFTGQTVPLLVSSPVVTNDPYGSLESSTGIWSSAPYAWAYQWQISDDGNTGWADIDGETSATHGVIEAESGKYLRIKVVATNGVGDSDPAYSASAVCSLPENTDIPTISGTAEVGSVLTATNGTWSNSPASYGYQWQLSSDGSTGWANINGATSSTYTLLASQEAKFVRVAVVATNGVGDGDAAYSAASAEIEVPAFPTNGLVAFWKLNDDGNGGLDLTDASSNGYTLTNNNGVALGAGKVAGAGEFDAGKWLTKTSGDVPLQGHSGDFSISGWVYRTSAPDHCSLVAWRQISGFVVGAGGPSETNANWAVADFDWDGDIVLFEGGGININEWNHYCVVREGTTISAYLNGVLAGTYAGYTGTIDPSGNYGFSIGANTDGTEFLRGRVDAVGLWSRALTEPEIAQLYNAGSGVEPA